MNHGVLKLNCEPVTVMNHEPGHKAPGRLLTHSLTRFPSCGPTLHKLQVVFLPSTLPAGVDVRSL